MLTATLPALLLALGAGAVQRRLLAEVVQEDVTTVDASVPRAAFLAQADRVLRDDLTAIGAVALGGIAVTWLGGELFLLRRVRRLLHSAECFASGEASAPGNGRSGELSDRRTERVTGAERHASADRPVGSDPTARAVAVLARNGREPFLLDAEDRELLDIFVSIVQRAA